MMCKLTVKKWCLVAGLLSFSLALNASAANNKTTEPMVAPQLFDKANANDHWKSAFATGKHAQIVFMSITPSTNPKNEIGVETHPFDQVIFVTEGNGKAVLNGKTVDVKAGDMIFIPLGTKHNVINSNSEKPLKIVSVYSDTDIPFNANYDKKENEPKE